MSYCQNSNISLGNNLGNSFDLFATAGPIIKELSKSFYLEKLVTSHDFSTLRLHMKRTIWVDGIVFNLVNSSWQYIFGIPKK